MSSSTALGAEKAIIFISDAHEKFYYEKLKEVRYRDVYHKALVYCLGISDDTRRNMQMQGGGGASGDSSVRELQGGLRELLSGLQRCASWQGSGRRICKAGGNGGLI